MPELPNEIKATLEEVFDVSVSAKLVSQKEGSPRIVTTIKFEYEGQPSAMEPVLMLGAIGKPVFVKFYTPQYELPGMNTGKKPIEDNNEENE